MHEFSEKDIVKGSGYISSQCCGSTERELGTVYAAEMGIYEISEANRTIRCLEIKAYDYMLRFEKDFNITETIGNACLRLAGGFLDIAFD